MVRSLIEQFSRQWKSVPRALESLFSVCTNGHRQPTFKELLMTLQQILKEFKETFIIFDALDECTEREELLNTISKMVKWDLGHLHVLATSPRERDIEEAFSSWLSEQEGVSIQHSMVNDDIRIYIEKVLQTDQGMNRWPQTVRDEIQQALMSNADGM